MSTSNATTESCAYAEKPSQAKTPKQAAQGAPSDKGGRPADAALLTPPLNRFVSFKTHTMIESNVI